MRQVCSSLVKLSFSTRTASPRFLSVGVWVVGLCDFVVVVCLFVLFVVVVVVVGCFFCVCGFLC